MNATMCNCSSTYLKDVLQSNAKTNEAGDDATWILTSAFIIFTMQSGFGLLEAGSVSSKNEANIMMKNAIDVVFGGLSYWICGFAFSFGTKSNEETPLSGFMGYGDFFTGTIDHVTDFGSLYSKYFFQLSFATTATTIVSGAMAERTNLKAYILFSFINTFAYIFPAHWVWDSRGFLYKLHVVDIAGCAPVHLVGGVSALVATLMLKPRTGIFDKDVEPPPLASPTNMMLGTFMLWWGWLGFNCGSTFGVSGSKWKLAARTAVLTINGSIGGGIWAIFYSYKLTKRYKGKLDIPTFINGVLGGLVGITAICSVCQPWAGFVIGFIGGIIATYGTVLLRYLKIDDPVSVIPVHGFCAIWGMIVVGLWAEEEVDEALSKYSGVFYGGPPIFLAYQCLACVVIIAWTTMATFLQLLLCDKLFGLRMTLEEEMIGADEVEHGIKNQALVMENGCPKCSLNNNSNIILNTPTVIFNKTYAKKIYNGDRGMINFGVSSNSHTSDTVDTIEENDERFEDSTSDISQEKEKITEKDNDKILRKELKKGNGVALLSKKRLSQSGPSFGIGV